MPHNYFSALYPQITSLFKESIMKKQTAIFVLALLSICSVHAFAADDSRRGEGREGREGRHHQPPPEAYTACEGKKNGDQAELTAPQGEIVTGTCVQEKDGDRLFLRPDRPPKGSTDRRGGGEGSRD
ncbi:hypothetical protein KKHLCK_07260 [Candidatus Electrothrix laxa]